MAINHTKSGPNSVPAYQMSGVPFLTSSISATEVPNEAAGDVAPIVVSFPYVTKFVKIRNTGGNGLRVAFSFTGSYEPGRVVKGGATKPASLGRNYFVIPTAAAGKESTQTFEFRCKKLFLLGDGGTTGFDLAAGLTTIRSDQFPELTGSVNGAIAFEGIG